MLTKKTAMTGLIAGAGLVLALPMGPATAKGGGDDRVEVSSEGQCSGTARWELKAKERDGGATVPQTAQRQGSTSPAVDFDSDIPF